MIESASAASVELYGQVLSCTAYEHLSHQLLEPVAQRLEATSGVFLQLFELPVEGSLAGRQSYVGKCPESADVYVEGVYNDDPVVQPSLRSLRSASERRPTTVTLLSTIPGWQDSAFYQKFLKPFDIGHVLSVAVPVRSVLGSELMCLGFHRSHDAQPFSSTEVDRLRDLVPVIQAVLSNLAYREAVTLSGTVFDAVSDHGRGMGFVVLDEDLIVRHANHRGLTQIGVYRHAQGKCALASDSLGELRRHIMRVPAGVGPRGSLNLVVPHPETSSLCTVNVDVRGFRAVDGRTYYLLITSEAGERKALVGACRRFDLSEREIEVARSVCAGQKNADIARELFIALRTVENHLRSIYAKAGVSSRTQLVSRLLGLS